MSRSRIKGAYCERRIRDHDPDLVLHDLNRGGRDLRSRPLLPHEVQQRGLRGGGREPGALQAHRKACRGDRELS